MTYLSRLFLNLRSREVRRDLADCQQLHRTVMRAFPQADDGEPARERFGVLYRLDTDRAGNAFVLVQSCASPDWSQLPAAYLLEEAASKPIDHVFDLLAADRAFIFRLRANPTRRIKTKSTPDGQRSNGTRVELHGEEEWLDWIRRKGEQYGFRLLTARAVASVADARACREARITGTRGAGQANGHVTLFPVLFEGRLAVTDPTLFRQGLLRGIGPGKAYGLGMLSLAPARTGGSP